MSTPLDTAIEAAQEAGTFLRDNFGNQDDLVVSESSQHDVKLELDELSQDMITKKLLGAFPDHALYGEEGLAGKQDSPHQWVVDPIDGTVNYYYGLPHYCVSIAMRYKGVTQLGVIYDPSTDELWTAERGQGAFLNGNRIAVSTRSELNEAVITVGFSKTAAALEEGLANFGNLCRQVRKVRIMGSAALGLAYIASGRLDAYVEGFISLWDIAAGVLLIEEAGGTVKATPLEKGATDKFSIIATNGMLELPLA